LGVLYWYFLNIIVDVRDVADLHIRAMTYPDANGERFIASADGQMSVLEIAALLKSKTPDVAKKISAIKIPNWVIYFAALFNKRANEGALFLRMSHNVSNQKAKQLLGWSPRSAEEAIIATGKSMMRVIKGQMNTKI
jgi:nucleoside-diphosphate-sugar epimerase